MPSPLPEVLKGLERFEVGPDYDHPGFNEMSPQEDGRWVRLSDVTDALRGEEGESGPERFVQDRDDLREVIDRACEATHKGDSPDAIAAYIWSHVGPLIADLESDAAEGWREAKENAAIGYGAGHPHPGRTSHRPRRALPRPIHTSRSRFGASGGGELARRARASKGHPMTNQSTLHGDDGGEERRSLQVEVGPEQTDFIRSELCKDCPQSVNNDASCLELLTAAIATNRTLEAACLSAREDADHYLRGREEAREGEDEFKEQADHLEGAELAELRAAVRDVLLHRQILPTDTGPMARLSALTTDPHDPSPSGGGGQRNSQGRSVSDDKAVSSRPSELREALEELCDAHEQIFATGLRAGKTRLSKALQRARTALATEEEQ